MYSFCKRPPNSLASTSWHCVSTFSYNDPHSYTKRKINIFLPFLLSFSLLHLSPLALLPPLLPSLSLSIPPSAPDPLLYPWLSGCPKAKLLKVAASPVSQRNESFPGLYVRPGRKSHTHSCSHSTYYLFIYEVLREEQGHL